MKCPACNSKLDAAATCPACEKLTVTHPRLIRYYSRINGRTTIKEARI